jgi:hypothetical protein
MVMIVHFILEKIKMNDNNDTRTFNIPLVYISRKCPIFLTVLMMRMQTIKMIIYMCVKVMWAVK